MDNELKQFIRRSMRIALPIMIQNAVTNLVGMLDNIMVGRIGTDPMSGVAIVNQLFFVWYLCIFGGFSGISIFTAQFYGKRDNEGVRYTFRLLLVLGIILAALGYAVLCFYGTPLIKLYLHSDGGAGSPELTLKYAKEYMALLSIGFLPFALAQAYGSVLRATGDTSAPMKATLVSVAVNLIGNYVLIYGKFGAPAMGVAGAAIATVVARFMEFLVISLHTHRNIHRYPFMEGVYSSIYIPSGLIRKCSAKGMPLLINEALWSGGQAVLMGVYAMKGLSVVAAYNISHTISEVFSVAFIAMGAATGIIMGQELGSGRRENLKRDAFRLTYISVAMCIISGALLFAISGVFPMIYNTSDDIRRLATGFIRIFGLCMPIIAYANSAYFILRSGGRTGITFLFDSCSTWLVCVPVSFLLARYTGINILLLFFIVQMLEFIKCIIGYILIKRGVWINDITEYR